MLPWEPLKIIEMGFFMIFLHLKTELDNHLKGHGYDFGQKLFLRF